MKKVSFLVHLLLEGLQRSSGVLFVALRKSLGCSRQSAALPFALSRGVSAATGVVLHLQTTNRNPYLGWGCFLSSVGVGLCFLATDIVWHSVFWGVLFGCGTGIASPILVSQLMQQKADDSVKSSIRSAGPSFGVIVLPFIISKLADHYGLAGCYVILSGIILNLLPLILIAAYRIRFDWLRTSLSPRKRSKRYEMSRKEDKITSVSIYRPRDIKEFYNQSFIQNLEPDTLEKVSDAEDSKSAQYIDILQPIIEAKLKMSGSICQDREAFGLEQKSLELKCSQCEDCCSRKSSNFTEDPNSGNNGRAPEMFSYNSDAVHESEDCSEIINSKPDEEQKHSVPNSANEDSGFAEESPEEADRKKGPEAEELATNIKQEDSPPTITTTNQIFHVKRELPNSVNRANFPLEIKVHVVECTITTTEDYAEILRNKELTAVKRNGYRRHSNSLITADYENIDFTQLFLNDKSSPLQKQDWSNVSRMCLISEEGESECGSTRATSREVEVKTVTHPPSRVKKWLWRLQELGKPSYLAIIYAIVIYEFSLAVLLTIFADFAIDTGEGFFASNVVMAAFGVGGAVGRLSFSHWGGRLLMDGSHAAAALLFMLNGLAAAGVLWSADAGWLSGFYALLGFVESGVRTTLPKLTSDYAERRAEKRLSAVSKGLSAAVFLCIPCGIGLSRDAAGHYDGLLQVTSCLSVLCALLCYFLPKMSGRKGAVPERDVQV
ncbi:uncharacterized protein CDAR_273731 [Caerostris darwini]|uniref:Monocarboxylate transporter n=1 Tax=Caerostris darwini TaxID=1538125 RepID=A0AAV4RCX9_9ARAC|nr:uncharacterized protein CDAR_273731 [Caerostris darwini]